MNKLTLILFFIALNFTANTNMRTIPPKTDEDITKIVKATITGDETQRHSACSTITCRTCIGAVAGGILLGAPTAIATRILIPRMLDSVHNAAEALLMAYPVMVCASLPLAATTIGCLGGGTCGCISGTIKAIHARHHTEENQNHEE